MSVQIKPYGLGNKTKRIEINVSNKYMEKNDKKISVELI